MCFCISIVVCFCLVVVLIPTIVMVVVIGSDNDTYWLNTPITDIRNNSGISVYMYYDRPKLPAAVTSPDQYSNHCHHKLIQTPHSDYFPWQYI